MNQGWLQWHYFKRQATLIPSLARRAGGYGGGRIAQPLPILAFPRKRRKETVA